MSRNIVLALTVSLLLACTQQEPAAVVESADQPDKMKLAVNSPESYGADDYGMKTYVMAFLKKGPNRPEDPELAAKLQQEHLANILRLRDEGKLVLSGPFLKDGELRGIYVFDVRTVEEARTLTESDPAIQHGSLVMELMPWYGSAGLLLVNEVHGKLARKSILDN